MNTKEVSLRTGFIVIASALMALVATFVSYASVVSAADEITDGSSSVTLSPTSNKFTVDAGSERRDKLTVMNSGTETLNFIVYGRPYEVTSGTYEPSFNGNASNSDAYKWLRLEKTEWTVEAGKNVEVPYTIAVPAGAAPGGHYGVIFVETKAPKVEGESLSRNKRLGTIILATVNGQFRTGGELIGTSITPVQFRSPLTTTTDIKNTGNADFPAKLTLTVGDVFGKTKFQSEKEVNIFPETTRSIKMDWADAPWFGLYKVSVKSEFLDQQKTNNSFVLILPRWMIAVILLVILTGGVYALRRRR